MSRRKRQPEQFDVVEFLRESDGDLKSALNSLLRSPAVGIDVDDDDPINSGPGLISGPGPELTTESNAVSRGSWNAGSNTRPGPNLIPDLILIPGPKLGQPNLNTLSREPQAPVSAGPGTELSEERVVTSISGPNLSPPPELVEPRPTLHKKKRQFPIREMKLAQDAHTRAEQQVYESLWQVARPLDDISRTITIGFGAMAKVVRLSESNARINVRNLIAKLAIQDLGDYNCERSVGRTYRILNYSEILRRRREVGLTWYMRRTLAVVFVDPQTGLPIDCKQSANISSIPGPNLIPPPGPNLEPEAPPNLVGKPGLNLGPPYREQEREIKLRESESSSASDSLLFEALSSYGAADDDVLQRLRAETAAICPDFTDDELLHFIHVKGSLTRKPENGITNPIGFLLTSVPKCFAGNAFLFFRQSRRQQREREAADQLQREADFDKWRRQQQTILEDPASSEEDRLWARKLLQLDDSS